MPDVIVVGDGPAGLSAALLLSKNAMDVEVFGENETRMHGAYLYNYLGIREIDGTEFMQVAREQCESFGVVLHADRVTSATSTDDGFTVTTASGERRAATYIVLAVGKQQQTLATELGMELEERDAPGEGTARAVFGHRAIQVGKNGRTSVENAYAGGWATDLEKVQAAIAVGDGARIAVSILSREAGEPVRDFDVPR